MNMFINTQLITASIVVSSSLFAVATESVVVKREVYVNNGNIVLDEGGEITQFIAPKKLLDTGRFQIRVNKPKKDVVSDPQAVAATTLSDRIEARRIMHDANQAYFKGEVAKTWELVAQAEKLDPKFYRVITMKGSLLYQIGSTELAVEVWLESLAQNPNQPEIAKLIESLTKKPATKSNVAGGYGKPTTKRVSKK